MHGSPAGYADDHIDLTVTSPPYNLHHRRGVMVKSVVYDNHDDSMPERTYQDTQIDTLNELYRATKPAGSCFYNHKVRWVSGEMIHPMQWLARTEWVVRQEIVWDRAYAMNVAGWRFWRTDERVYWLYKPDASGNKVGKPLSSASAKLTGIWKGQAEYENDHPAPFPLWLPARCIYALLGRDTGKLVFDPYLGSGTTGTAAMLLGHNFIGCDMSNQYVHDAAERITHPEEESKLVEAEIAKHA